MSVFGTSSNAMETLRGALQSPWVLYILGFVLVTLVVLMLMQFKFNILPSYLDPRTAKSKLESSALTFWKGSNTTVTMKVGPADFKRRKIPFDRYTVMIDMLWGNTRTVYENGQYRHILHRGTPDIVPADNLDLRTVGGTMGPTAATTPSKRPDGTTVFGLPNRMNPGIMADPVTNDMIVFVDTESGGEFYRESVRIPDIPLDQPFTLTVVVMNNFLEVYVNCGLEVTKVLNGIPRRVEENWYGLAGQTPLPGLIQNLRLWETGLNVSDIRNLCSSTIDFKSADVKCPTVPPQQFLQ